MTVTAREIARAIKVAPRTRRFVLRDEYGCRYDGRQAHLVLAALSRSDRSEGLTPELRTVAHALWKSMTTARMDPTVATTGGVCDGWLPKHQHELVSA